MEHVFALNPGPMHLVSRKLEAGEVEKILRSTPRYPVAVNIGILSIGLTPGRL